MMQAYFTMKNEAMKDRDRIVRTEKRLLGRLIIS